MINRDYEVVIGLEVHAELCTETKIFCGCKNAFGAEVNTLCCPVCMGMPGTLPVLNKQVVDYAIKTRFQSYRPLVGFALLFFPIVFLFPTVNQPLSSINSPCLL